MISMLLSAMLLVVVDPPVAATAATPLTNAAMAESPKKERQVCKREPISGSLHGSKRVCMTAREWREGKSSATYEDLGSVSTK